MYLKLYILNDAPVCRNTLDRINEVLKELSGDNYRIEVIDLEKHPDAAEEAQILAIPTLIKETPRPSVRLVGDLSSTDTLMKHLAA